MAKRLTDTAKWDRQWFREMPVEYKAFWTYLCDRCDHAGLWHKDLAMASFYIGAQIEAEKALGFFGDRVKVMADDKWFVERFISFQYGELKNNNSVHAAVLRTLQKHGVDVGAPQPAYVHHKTRDFVIAESGGRCIYCVRSFGSDPVVDHLIPRVNGGSSEGENMAAACRACNSRKGQMSVEEYIEIFHLDRDGIIGRLEALGKVWERGIKGAMKRHRKGGKGTKDKDKDLDTAKAKVKAKASVGGVHGD